MPLQLPALNNLFKKAIRSIMKHRNFIFLNFILPVIFLACSKDNSSASGEKQLSQGHNFSTNASSVGATQISGLGYWDANDQCNSAGQGADFALTMTGDIDGCLYVFVDEFDCSPSGTYREEGRELFVGTYKGQSGTFWTKYKFEAKYEGCSEDGSYVGLEILGRCQHPVVEGSGTGVFAGVSGRLDLKDDIEAANYPYRGHFRF
jgi:hypothetical protein